MSKNQQVKQSGARYRGLITSIAVFLLLIAAILGLNLYSSIQINRDNTAINAATKMRDNIQAINRDLLNLKLSYGEDVFSPNISSSIQRLNNNTEFFSKALKVFDEGGELTGQGIEGYIAPLNAETHMIGTGHEHTADEALAEIKNEWEGFKPSILSYTKSAQNINTTSTPLDLAVNQAQGSGVIIYNAMEEVVKDIKTVADNRANLLTFIQIAGILAIILYFLAFIFFFIKRLRQSDSEAEEARQETADILQTVDSGLFLLDKDLNIGGQHSKALSDILYTQSIGGKNLAELLEGIVSKQDVETTGEFIQQLYNPRVKERLIDDLNPLRKINVNLKDGSNTLNRYLDFNFSRIYKNKEISHILVSVNDITNATLLEERLEQERRQNDEQIQMVTTILNSDIRLVREFVKSAKKATNKINDTLKDSKKGTHIFEEKLRIMFREAHSLKGEASALKLTALTKQVGNFEENIKVLQQKAELSGDDFLPLTVRLDDIISQVQTIGMLSQRLGVVQVQQPDVFIQSDEKNEQAHGIPATVEQQPTAELDKTVQIPQASVVADLPAEPVQPLQQAEKPVQQIEQPQPAATMLIPQPHETTDGMSVIELEEKEQTPQPQTGYQVSYYKSFVGQLAKRSQKQITLHTEGVENLNNQTEKHRLLKEIALQLLRNAVTHGIETPGERMASYKEEMGNVSLSFKETPHLLSLTVEDDGGGINYDSIRQKAIASGKYSPQEVASWDNKRLLSLIFSSGFSTASEVTEDAGQGVGLDVVKSRVIELGAKMKVDTDFGKFTRFTVACES